MNFRLRVWRQLNAKSPGKLVNYEAREISPNTSFLEMLDILNENLLGRGEEPIAFESDCREGICGVCSLTINGEAHGPDHPGAVCELYMRNFRDGATITVEPFRVRSFSIIKDLVIDRSSLDRTQFQFQSTMPILQWKLRLASAVVRVPRPVQTGPPCFSRRRKCHIYRCCLREIPSA